MNARSLAELVGWCALLSALLAGCSDNFIGEEMRLGETGRIRPLGITLEPPEAAPGDTVCVEFHWFDAEANETRVHWKAALEFEAGGWEVDPIERRIVDLSDAPGLRVPVSEGFGFQRQTLAFVVPDSVLLWPTSASRFSPNGTLEEAARANADLVNPTAAAWNEFLSSASPSDLATLDRHDEERIRRFIDLFASQVRFRISLSRGDQVDVTRNLTVRYSGRFASPNTNLNPDVGSWSLVGLPIEDAEWHEALGSTTGAEWVPLTAASPGRRVQISWRRGWTYYLVCNSEAQSYGSPFSAARLEERLYYRWYRFWIDGVQPDVPLFVRDDGEEAEMGDLDESVRLELPSGVSTCRVYMVVRDDRPEWRRYQQSHGQRVTWTDIEFCPSD